MSRSILLISSIKGIFQFSTRSFFAVFRIFDSSSDSRKESKSWVVVLLFFSSPLNFFRFTISWFNTDSYVWDVFISTFSFWSFAWKNLSWISSNASVCFVMLSFISPSSFLARKIFHSRSLNSIWKLLKVLCWIFCHSSRAYLHLSSYFNNLCGVKNKLRRYDYFVFDKLSLYS